MNSRERFNAVLTGKPADRVPFMKVFGGTNAIVPGWEKERPGIKQEIDVLLGFEGRYRGWDRTLVNMGLSNLPPTEVVEETEDKLVERRGDGTVAWRNKGVDFGYHTIEWPVKDRADWQRVKERFMQADDPSRFPDDWAAAIEEYRQRDYPLQLSHGGVYGFIRNLMGDEVLAYAFYDDPELVHDIMDTYTTMAIDIWSRMVTDVQFDLIETWEDMCFRSGTLVSPKTFREFLKPNFQRIAEFARQNGIEIVLSDSDGNIEELTGLMLESGVTTLYPYEVQAGNDLARLLDEYPKLSAIGGLNKNVMAAGKEAIDREMERARGLIAQGRFIPGPDHFVLSDVSFENYAYFMRSLKEVIETTPPGTL